MNIATLRTKAKKHHQAGEFEEAQRCYEELLKLDSQQPDIHHLLGILLAQSKNYEHALKHFDLAIGQEPETAAFYNSKGNLLMRMQCYAEALPLYQKALTINPNYAAVFNNLGNWYYYQKKFTQAQENYQKALALEPNYADALFNYGRLQAEMGNLDTALEYLEKSKDIHPHPQTLSQLGQVYLEKKIFDKALDCFEKKLAFVQNASSYYDLGIAFLHLKKFNEAIIAFEEALGFEKNFADAHYWLGLAFLENQQQPEALKHFLRQLEKAEHLESYFNVGVLLMYQEKHQEALGYFAQVLKLNPNYLEAHLNMAAIALKISDTKTAIEHYQKILTLKPQDAETLHILSALEQNLNIADQAPKEFVTHLFDQYAPYYEQHLLKHLGYQVHTLIKNALETVIPNTADLNILDLGCGTGLCGELLKPWSKKLIGIDISQKMLDFCREKNIYDQLILGNVTEKLAQLNDIDVILAADVFTYFGDLNEIFALCHQVLNSNGYFAFSVEKTGKDHYQLQKSIRYAHPKHYIETLLLNIGFTLLNLDTIVLRYHHKKPVEGYLVVAKKEGG